MLKRLKHLGAIPLTHSVLLSYLDDYKNPNDKIKHMIKSKELIRIKQALYVLGNIYCDKKVSKGLLANQIYGPSYLSMDYALSFYGLIPERVYEITSVTTKMFKKYDTPFGRFNYVKSPLALYSIGLRIEQENEISYMIATAEKALCDKVVFTKNLGVLSVKDMTMYIEDDLRIDLEDLKFFDLDIIYRCSKSGYKSTVLMHLYKAIKRIQG